MGRKKLLNELRAYRTGHNEEKLFVSAFIELIENHANPFDRSLLKGHITGSAWIVNPGFNKVLLVNHKKLDRWLQPGGHADGEEDISKVAQQELFEETGLSRSHLVTSNIFDLDIHLIPQFKQTPAHYHYDIRYLFVAQESEPTQISSESKDLRWWKLTDLLALAGEDRSMMRLVEKTNQLSRILFKTKS